MKRRLLAALFAVTSILAYSQSEEIIDPVETHAMFRGGEKEMWCFIERNLSYSELRRSNNEGIARASFVVEKDGRISNVKCVFYKGKSRVVVRDAVVEKEVARVIRIMPRWEPAIQMNVNVRVSYSLPLKIPYSSFKCISSESDTTVYYDCDISADFTYGDKATLRDRINDFLLSNLTLPNDDDCVGTVYVRVVVEKDGSLSLFKVERSLDKAFDQEALRVIKAMPKWKPALRRGEVVRSYMIIPVKFMW
ncbi:energy transducer TonB [Alistipes sp. ZOR0009]|uniref:energy transducer TonB n=1 Tax=Alistipes sp. ZOR0009 TaxID=1339253 RepID=UPI000645CD9E|nr:TonB family protein [Alistipes sp. ZOR0009]